MKTGHFSWFSEVLLEHFKVVYVLFCFVFRKSLFTLQAKNDMWAGTLLLPDV